MLSSKLSDHMLLFWFFLKIEDLGLASFVGLNRANLDAVHEFTWSA